MAGAPPKADFEARLREALSLEVPYGGSLRERFLRRPLLRWRHRPAAVLLLLAPESRGGRPSLLVTRRTDRVETHKGQMAFPGGIVEPEDASPRDAALRETEEEVGIPRGAVRVLGSLPPLSTVATSFWVTPFVGMSEIPVPEIVLQPNPDEIAEALWVPVERLTSPDVYGVEWMGAGPLRVPTHVYRVEGHRIWGATAAMIKNLLDRLGTVC